MLVRIQVVWPVVQSRKLKSKETNYTRSEVAKKEGGAVLPHTIHKSDSATGIGRDLGVAGPVSSHQMWHRQLALQEQEVLCVSDLVVVTHIRTLTPRAHLQTPSWCHRQPSHVLHKVYAAARKHGQWRLAEHRGWHETGIIDCLPPPGFVRCKEHVPITTQPVRGETPPSRSGRVL